jgi:hypothetical protein
MLPRSIDLIRASKLPSNMMQFAAKGALSVPPEENLEILVYLAKHNKIFGDLARMTLAGWDEKVSLAAASDPKTAQEVLDYLVSPENLRPKLLPALVENPSIPDSKLAKFAISASHESIEVLLQSARVRSSAGILDSLRSNPYLKGDEAATIAKLLKPDAAQPPKASATNVGAQVMAPASASKASATEVAKAVADETGLHEAVPDETRDHDEVISAYLAEHSTEIAQEQDKPFQPVGGMVDLVRADEPSLPEDKETNGTAGVEKTAAASTSSPAAAASSKSAVAAPPAHRDNAVQKINRLDVKGRIQLAMKGNKEERSILVRDGTKVVALAVLDAPKLSDGEVEKFALQKNVLEAVLRQIPLKRRFMKNYIVVRNLVSNPRTPLDLGLGLMKHLQIQDLKNISANKEISETVRKLALKMYKQKLDSANKK